MDDEVDFACKNRGSLGLFNWVHSDKLPARDASAL